MLTDSLLNELKTNVKINEEYYINKNKFISSFIPGYESKLYSLQKKVEYPQLNFKDPTDKKRQWEIDCENAITLYEKLVLKYDIGIDILSDERFIAFLTHDIYFDYMCKRWPVDKEHTGRILEKYFLPAGSQAFTRNTFLRYFWYCYITYDKSSKDHYHLTKIAFEYADPVNQLMERKYSRNGRLLKCILTAIEKTPESKCLPSKRTFLGKSLNNILGLICLDVLSDEVLVELVTNEIKKIASQKIEDSSKIEEE